ncbi:MAG: DNA repair protein RadC [Bilophila sp.]
MSSDKPHYLGHRARLRERFGQDSSVLEEYEVLEVLLGYGLPRRDTKPIAKELLDRFGTIRDVMEAVPAELQDVPGVGVGVTTMLHVFREMWARCAETPTRKRELLCTPEAVARMVTARLSGCPHEELWLATVDAQNRQIGWERVSKGTIGTTPCYPREVLELAIKRKASGFILVHNHPGGTPRASAPDLEVTRNLEYTAQGMGLRLLDHIILSDGVCYSIRKEGLINARKDMRCA